MQKFHNKALLSFCLLPTLCFASGVADLGNIAVTATKTPRLITQLPENVHVITQEDIQNSNAHSVDEVLKSFSGIDVVHNLGILSSGSTSKVILRGVGGTGESRSMLLVDGIPMNDAFSGAVAWNQIPLESIERIEVVKGVSSSLYGSNAMGGAVNIITKTPSDPSLKTKLSYGSMNTKTVDAQLSGKTGRFSYLIHGQRVESDGYIVELEEDRADNTVKTGVKRDNILTKLSYEIDDSSDIGISYNYYKNKQTGALKIEGEDYNPGIDRYDMYSLHYSKQFQNESDLKVSLFDKQNTTDKDYLKNATTIEYAITQETEEKGITTQYSYPFTNQIVTVGADVQKADVSSQNLYPDATKAVSKGQQDYYAAFIQNEIFFGDNVVVNIGARYDRYKNHDGSVHDEENDFYESYKSKTLHQISPKLAILYHLTDTTTLRSSLGEAFRAPSVNDLYKSTIKKGKISAGNPNLKPETIRSFDLSLEQQFLNSGLFRITGYHSIFKDYIYSMESNDPTYYKEKINVGEAKIQGIETQIEYKPLSVIKLTANYSYTKATIEKFEKDQSFEGKDIIRVPRHKASASILYTDPSLFDVKVTTNYVGKRYEKEDNENEFDSYVTTDLKVSKKINKNFTIALKSTDLFNEAYAEKYLSPGRVVMGSVSITF